MEIKYEKILTMLMFIMLLGFIYVGKVSSIVAPPSEWMPPIDIEWTSERGSPDGVIEASPIPNVNETIWSKGGPPSDLGFSVKTERDLFPLAPLIIDKTVILHDSEDVYALYLENGTVKWGVSIYWDNPMAFPWYVDLGLGLEVFVKSLASQDDCLFIATSADIAQKKGRVISLNASTGDLIWVQTLVGQENTGVFSNIVAVAGRVYVGTIWNSHRVYSLNPTDGNIIWNTTLPTSSNVQGIAVAQNMVFATNEAGEIYAIDAQSGQILWSTNPNSLDLSIPVFNNGYVYLTSLMGNLIEINSTTGEIVKKLNVNAGYTLAPQIFNDKIFISEALGAPKGLVALDADTWSEVWKFSDPAITSFDTPPIITTGTISKIIVGAKGINNTVFAVHQANGSLAWKYTLPPRDFIMSISQGKLVLAQRGENRWEGTVRVFGELESPIISDITHTPLVPRSTEKVNISCIVADKKSGLYRVMLSWSLDAFTWTHDVLNLEASGRYVAVLNPQPNGTKVYYKITAIDNVGNWKISHVSDYTVFDPYIPPTIRITEPENGTTIETSNVMIKWTITQGSFDIKKIEIRLDSSEWIEVTGKTSYNFEQLSQGNHTITVKIYDAKGTTDQSAVSFKVTPPPTPFPDPIFIIIVGVVLAVIIGSVAWVLKRRK
ncbi:MAG: PQQ-binding-like beta-propeller repeat protein [Candidatus Bathyarchaeia archaeon]